MRNPNPIIWYALLDTGDIVKLGDYSNFQSAADAADRYHGGVVWIVDWHTARHWCDTLKEIT